MLFAGMLRRYLGGKVPQAQGLSEERTVEGLTLSIWEGALYIVAINLIGGPFLAGYALFMGAGPRGVALAAALPALSGVVQVIAAPLIERLRRRIPPIAMGALIHRLGWGLGGFLPLLLPREYWFPAYMAVLFFSHMGQAAIVPTWYSLMSDMAREEIRGRFFGVRNALHSLVQIATLLAAGALLDRAGGGLRGFLLLHGASLLFGLGNIYMLSIHPEPRHKPAPKVAPLAPFRDPAFRLTAAFVAGWTLAQTLSTPFYAIVMLKVMKLSYTTVSWLTITAALATAVSLFAWGPLCDRLGEGRFISLVAPAAVIVPLGWLLATRYGLPLLFVLQAVQGAATAGINLALANLNLAIAGDRKERPAYLACFAAGVALMGGVGPLLGGLIGRPSAVFLTAGIASALLWTVWWFWYRPHHIVLAAIEGKRREATAAKTPGLAGARHELTPMLPFAEAERRETGESHLNKKKV